MISIMAILFTFLIPLPALAQGGGPSAGVNTQNRESFSTKEGVERSREMEVRRGREERASSSNEVNRTIERGRAKTESQDLSRSQSQRLETQYSLDSGPLLVQALAQAEGRRPLAGVVGRNLRKFALLTGQEWPLVAAARGGSWTPHTGGPGGWIVSPAGKPPAAPVPFSSPTLRNIASAWILYGSLAARALDILPRVAAEMGFVAGNKIYLPAPGTAQKAVRRALEIAAKDPGVIRDAKAKISLLNQCLIPTEHGYFIGGKTEFRCGPLHVDPRGRTAEWGGSPLVSAQGAFGRHVTISIASAQSIDFARKITKERHEKASIAESRRQSREKSRNSSTSAAMRRSRSNGTTTETSESSDTNSGVTVSPQ